MIVHSWEYFEIEMTEYYDNYKLFNKIKIRSSILCNSDRSIFFPKISYVTYMLCISVFRDQNFKRPKKEVYIWIKLGLSKIY